MSIDKKAGRAIPANNRQAAIGSQKLIDVAAAVIFRGEKLLITQRHKDAHLGGLWEFPGGKREADETFEECLVRELREELGIEAAVEGLLEDVTHVYADKRVRLKFFTCRVLAGEPQALGCAAVKWIGKTELAVHEFPAADAHLLQKLRFYDFP
jgi:mutator protein MutT